MILKELVQKISSDLTSQGIEDSEIFASEIVDLINQNAEQFRLVDVKGENNISFYTIEKKFNFTRASLSFPDLYETTISPQPIQELDTEDSVVSSIVYLVKDKLMDKLQTFVKGDFVRKGNHLYECIETFENLNTYNKTFEGQDVIHYRSGMDINKDDVLFSPVTGSYYHATSALKPQSKNPEDEVGLDKLYWVKRGMSYMYGLFVPFDELRTSKLTRPAYSIFKGKVYTNKKTQINLFYVPDYERIEEPDDELDLPNEVIIKVRKTVVQELARKTKRPVESDE